MNIGWIGVGKMGSRMSSRLIKAGYELFVNDLSDDNINMMIRKGAQRAVSPKDLTNKCNTIISMVPDGKALLDIVNGKNGLTASRENNYVFIDMSTVDPRSSVEVGRILNNNNVEYLRSSVTGSIEFAEKGMLGIMVSGNKKTYEKYVDLFSVLGNKQTFLGSGEQAKYMKISINMMVGNTMQMLAESIMLAEKAQIPWELIIDMLSTSAASSPIIQFKTNELLKRNYNAMSTSYMMEKDMRIALEIGDEMGLNLPLTSLSKNYYGLMRSYGWEEKDYSGIISLNEMLNKIPY